MQVLPLRFFFVHTYFLSSFPILFPSHTKGENPKMTPTHLTADSFMDFTAAPAPVLVDFYTDPAAACLPVLEEVSAARPDVPVGMVNVEEEPDLARAFVVRRTPAFLLWKNGELHSRWTGEVPAGVILDAVAAESAEFPEPPRPADPSVIQALHDYDAHCIPRMYAPPLSSMPFTGTPGQFTGIGEPWQTW